MKESCVSPSLAMMETSSKEEHPRKLKKTETRDCGVKLTEDSSSSPSPALEFSPPARPSGSAINESFDTELPSPMAPAPHNTNGTVFNSVQSSSKHDSKSIVPDSPPYIQKKNLIGPNAIIGDDESYGHDERMLNDFMRLHPMLRCAYAPSLAKTRRAHTVRCLAQHGSDLFRHAPAPQLALSESQHQVQGTACHTKKPR